MHRTEDDNNVGNLFTDGPPGTTVGASIMNAIQEELINILVNAGVTPLTAATDTRDQLAALLLTTAKEGTGNGLDADTVDGSHVTDIAVRDLTRGLVVKNNAVSPNSKMDVDANEVVMYDSNNFPKKSVNTNLTIDMAVSGAEGLDTPAEAAAIWYHIWVIAKADGTVAGLFSTSATAPTMPTDYLYKALVSAVYNDAGENFDPIHQIGNKVVMAAQQILNGGNQVVYTPIDLSAMVPATAKSVDIYWGPDITTNEAVAAFASDVSGFGAKPSGNTSTGPIFEGVFGPVVVDGILMTTAQTIYYKLLAAGAPIDAYATGWEYSSTLG